MEKKDSSCGMNTADNILGILLRVVALPFVLAIITLHYLRFISKMLYNFMAFGGETIIYHDKTNRRTILNVYDKLNESLKE